ncbi:MAG: Fe-S protein assembly co-chaperone HscB [Betaproteobacteria bacterium]|nr:Fe-S protein assembly co-chaperone HscB [Betaproteobacteria bacterium]
MLPDFKASHFELFGLPATFQLDLPALEQAYRSLQAQVHPDKFAHLPEAEQRLSMQWSTRVNEAWQVLRSPISRAAYLLSLQGVNVFAPGHAALPAAFLMQQIEWREAIGEARANRNSDALQRIEDEIRSAGKRWQARLADELDRLHDEQAAAQTVRQLKFVEKIQEEIDTLWSELES